MRELPGLQIMLKIDKERFMNDILFNGGAIMFGISALGLITYIVVAYVRKTKLKARLDLEYGENN